MKYDCIEETRDHQRSVRSYLYEFIEILKHRAQHHDNSKLSLEEKPGFDEFTPKLKESTYGTEEYKNNLEGLKNALTHHYANNPHHPEYYENGINDMTLIDIIEMFFDWRAATERHDDGDIWKSFEINAERFGISEQLIQIFKNTASRTSLCA